MPTQPTLKLKGYTFSELLTSKGLSALDVDFLERLKTSNLALHNNLLAYRQKTHTLSTLNISELLLAVAPFLEEFLIELFDIEEAAALQQAKTLSQNPVSAFKKYFVLRRAKKNKLTENNFNESDTWLKTELKKAPLKSDDLELAISLLAAQYIAEPEKFADQIEKLTTWCTYALYSEEGRAVVKNWTSFKIPERIDHFNLVPHEKKQHDKIERISAIPDKLRLRDGFKLTDPRMSMREAQDEVNYCIYCHDHEGDFCSKGFPVKKGDPSLGLKKNPLDITMTGCPLDEKISEMHLLKRDGLTIAALAMIMVDNPMCPATGHRICNDCMKACVYQKQDPVNIPQAETRILIDALNLPWGVEIYDLLTRWNPLRQNQWFMKPYNGLKIMIAGMGPAGFTLAHHLLLEGFAVVGFDGLKIEPLPQKLLQEPIYRFDDLKESLDSRLMAGFGGVAEYGITVRWDKNFLKLIYISLMRRPTFQVFGSTRLGGTIHVDDVWEMGFDHFVLAVGAGLPKALPIPGSLAPGMRQANDFLMALQLGNAAKNESLTNIQIRLPAVVIGGGLTGVDTATEVSAYYIRQVEKTLYRYERLTEKNGEESVRHSLDTAHLEILDEFLSHGKAVRKERERAASEKSEPNFIKLIHQWGGVTIVYRRKMQESPAYIRNHEELAKALEEGIYYLEELEPSSVELNAFGHVETLICHKRFEKAPNEWEVLSDDIRIPARSIFVATGTQPNTAYEFEHRGTFTRQGLQYQHYEEVDHELIIPHGITHCKEEQFGPFTSYHKDDHRVSLIGDTHPVFHGSVVKAIASGMRTYPKILTSLQNRLNQTGNDEEYRDFARRIQDLFTTTISEIKRCHKNILELTIHSPLAAKHFQPGQFYRLQNYETYAAKFDHTSLQIEPVALIAAGANETEGKLKFIILETGASTKLCATFKAGDPVSLMGPTGVRAKVAKGHETVFILGNTIGIPFMLSYGHALKQMGNRVIFMCHFKSKNDLYSKEDLHAIADVIIWVTDENEIIPCERPSDYSASGNPIEVLLQYARGQLDAQKSQPEIPLTDIDRLYIINHPEVLRRFQKERTLSLKEFLIKSPEIYGSVFSTMQCMLKGVCAQCLQWQVDPETGKRTKAVFACSWPNQPLELIDFDNINERQIQNRLQEKLSSLWVDYLFANYAIPRI